MLTDQKIVNQDIQSKIELVYLIGHLGKGGSERQLYLILRYIDKKIFKCSVLVFNSSPNETYDDELKRLGIKITFIPNKARGFFRKVLFIYRILKKIKPHIVHSWTFHDNPYAGLIGWLVGVSSRYGSMRGSLSLFNMGILTSFVRLICLHSVPMIVVNCKALKEECTDNYMTPERIFVLANCFSDNKKDRVASNKSPKFLKYFGITNEHRVIGTVGNLRRVKNHELFIDGISRIVGQFEDVRALIVGQPISSEPEYQHELENRINDLGLKDIVFLTGFFSNVSALLLRFNIFCLTSKTEGVSNALLEAMAAGCPVISTAVGGIPEIIRHLKNGLMIKPGDRSGFSNALGLLLRDENLAKKLGRAARLTIENNHQPENIVQKLEDLYLSQLH